ncbi:hypothetical protein EJ110_NYTH09360, partial [Nymphaea thermarum]
PSSTFYSLTIFIFQDRPHVNISLSNKRGDVLLAMGSPFGILSPLHFFNSVSVGVVANCCPSVASCSSLLMADIRCLPGVSHYTELMTSDSDFFAM